MGRGEEKEGDREEGENVGVFVPCGLSSAPVYVEMLLLSLN